jgi:peptide/nickel transport system substrate-binding protein
VFSGETVMAIDKGIENGLASPTMSPAELAPTSQQQLEWPKWGEYAETKTKSGEKPELPDAIKLKELYDSWLGATSEQDQARIWHDMLQLWADDVFTIGLIAGVLQPVVVNDRLRNVPTEGIFNWNPGAHFGIYKPDGFWFDQTPSPSASAALSPPR